MEIERQTTVYCSTCKVTRRVRPDSKELTCPVCSGPVQAVIKDPKAAREES